jgi:hypothetical protein
VVDQPSLQLPQRRRPCRGVELGPSGGPTEAASAASLSRAARPSGRNGPAAADVLGERLALRPALARAKRSCTAGDAGAAVADDEAVAAAAAAPRTTQPPWLCPNMPIGTGAPAARSAPRAAAAAGLLDDAGLPPVTRRAPTPRLSNDAQMPAPSRGRGSGGSRRAVAVRRSRAGMHEHRRHGVAVGLPQGPGQRHWPRSGLERRTEGTVRRYPSRPSATFPPAGGRAGSGVRSWGLGVPPKTVPSVHDLAEGGARLDGVDQRGQR